MAEKSKTQIDEVTGEKLPRVLPANTPIEEQEAQAILASADTSKRLPKAKATDIEDDGVDELPKDAALVGGASLTVRIASATAAELPSVLPPYTDEYVGVGGSYVVGDDGVRRKAYEAYVVGEGNDAKRRFRPIP